MNYFKRAATFLTFPAIILVLLGCSYLRLFDLYELETLDARFLLRPSPATTDKVVLIEIGEDTIEKLGRFPFSRAYHAFLVNALSASGAKAVLFDIFFSESEEHDPELTEAMKKAGNVYLPFVFDISEKRRSSITTASGYVAKELPELAEATKGMGHINISPDQDGKFRRVPLLVSFQGRLQPYLSLLATCEYLGITPNEIRLFPGKYIQLGKKRKIPLDDQSNMIINFSGKWGKSYQHYSYVDILQSYVSSLPGQKPAIDLSVLKDKVCVIGLTAAGTVDLHPNPLETLYPGVGIHAEVFNSLVNERYISRASRGVNVAIVFILNLLVWIASLRIKPLKMLGMLAGLIAIYALTAVGLFIVLGIWIDLFYPTLAMGFVYLGLVLYKYVGEWKKRVVMESELDIAKKIQESFLPKILPDVAGIEVAATMFTAHQVGGDLYDFLVFDPKKMGIMIGDVSGKGVPASLFMAMVTGRFKFFATPTAKPEDVLFKLNTVLSAESQSNLFVTVFYAIFDLSARSFVYANGGHLPMIQAGPDRELKFLDVSDGAPLGLMDGPYSAGSATFQSGDLFVFYTDGITEAMNMKGDMYEKERLAALIESHKGLPAKALLSAIEKDVRRFEPKGQQHDDMTIIVMKIL